MNPFLLNLIIPTLCGVAFAFLQTSLFLTVQIYYSATIIGYFIILGSWFSGVLISLLMRKSLRLIPSLLVSLIAYYGLHLIVRHSSPSSALIPVICLLSIVVAQPAGRLLRDFSSHMDSADLLFWENNGFVAGLLACLALFMRYGVQILEWGPLSVSLACILCLFSSSRPILTAQPEFSENPVSGKMILFLAGCNALLLQYFIVRSFSVTLRASELTFILTGAFYMSGYSIGFFIGPKIPRRIASLSIFSVLPLTLIIIIFAKPIASSLIAQGHGPAAIIFLLFLTTVASSSFYSMLLPRTLITHRMDFITGYIYDFYGALTGVLILLIGGTWAPSFLWPLSLCLLAILSMILLPQWRVILGLSSLIIISWFSYHQQDLMIASSTDYYASRGIRYPKVLFTGDSFYHSVDIVETYEDAAQTRRISRQSYLNGVKYFESLYRPDGTLNDSESSLSEFTYFLAELPAKYLKKQNHPLNVLILGGGSLTNIRRVSPYADRLTLVEIDPLVVQTSATWWSDSNRLSDFPQARIVIDDVRHYLMSTSEKYDLIINDISAPYYLGTALLHSEDFYRLLKEHLAEDGILSESTQARPNPQDISSAAVKILKGIDNVFPHYRIIDGEKEPRGRRGYVYATSSFPLSTYDISEIMKKDDKFAGAAIYSEKDPHFDLKNVIPFSFKNIETLLSSNWNLIRGRLTDKNKADPQTGFWNRFINLNVTRMILGIQHN